MGIAESEAQIVVLHDEAVGFFVRRCWLYADVGARSVPGSTLRPAAFNRLTGIRFTHGVVSR